MVYLTCAIIGLGGRGVIKTWTEVAAGVRLYILMSDLTSLVPLQFSHWLQVRKVGTVYNIFIYFLETNDSNIDDNVTLDLFWAKFTDPCLMHNPLTLKNANSKMFNYRELAS